MFAPAVGYDTGCCRLGYLRRGLLRPHTGPAAAGRRGDRRVGYAEAEIATIYPQPFDIPDASHRDGARDQDAYLILAHGRAVSRS
jgi:hypothetical protein